MKPNRITATEAAQLIEDNRDLAFAIDRLLHSLRDFMRAYPTSLDAEMPDHRMQWVSGIDDSPARTILDAIKSHPELWRAALPNNVCLAPTDMLEKILGISPEVVAHLHNAAENIVATAAAAYRDAVDRRHEEIKR